jgi:hypothetical protein
MSDIAPIILLLLSLAFYFWAWLKILFKAFADDWRWGWAVLLLNQPFNIPALAYLYIVQQERRSRYVVALFAPYLALALLLARFLDWPQILGN